MLKPRSRLALLAVATLGVAGFRPALYHVEAAGVLLRLSAAPAAPAAPAARPEVAAGAVETGAVPHQPSLLAGPVVTTELTVNAPAGAARARLYEPLGVASPPGLVMVHGVHRLGMDEPRLVRFARSVASTGILVLTPDVRELADYEVSEKSIGTIGASAALLDEKLARHGRESGVGVMGLSFAGGLALLAAADPAFAPHVAYVVSVGAHDDLARVSRFFATSAIEEADGTVLHMAAHDYGPLVLVYAHAADFFPADDVPAAREALRLWLWEERDEARRRAEALPEASRAKLLALFERKIDVVAPELLADVEARGAEMRAVSPHGRLGALRVPVFLLHGAKDNVIPASETLWLATELPPAVPREVLVSNLIGHVEVEGEPPLAERWAALHFFAGVLARAHDRAFAAGAETE